MGSPTRFTSGVATVPSEELLGNYPFPDPFHTSGNASKDVVTYENDFFTVGSTTLDWTITGVSSTFAITSGLGGVALVTPGGATTVTTVAGTANGFQFIAGNSFWYICRIKANAVSGTKSFTFGLQNGNAGTTTGGIFFTKPASSTSINLTSEVNNVVTTLLTGITTVAADTYIELGFYYDGTDLMIWNGANMVSRISNPTIGSTGTTLTNALLTPVFQTTPTAITDTLSIDYVLAAQELTR
jgi:hypothetical protein